VDGQHFYQYQQNEHSPLPSMKIKNDDDIYAVGHPGIGLRQYKHEQYNSTTS
jgi:hypothetical protein